MRQSTAIRQQRKAAARNAWISTIARHQQPTQSSANDIAVFGWIGLNNLLTAAKPTADDWGNLAHSANMALMLAEDGICADAIELIQRCQEALVKTGERGTTTGAWRLDGAAIEDMRLLLEIHDKQCAAATDRQMQNAIKQMRSRIEEGTVFN